MYSMGVGFSNGCKGHAFIYQAWFVIGLYSPITQLKVFSKGIVYPKAV